MNKEVLGWFSKRSPISSRLAVKSVAAGSEAETKVASQRNTHIVKEINLKNKEIK